MSDVGLFQRSNGPVVGRTFVPDGLEKRMDVDLSTVEPFEICSIRPPTENYSLTFRLTRNCYWNHCAFCPVYKFGARFSKRGLDEVVADIRRAKRIDDLLQEQGVGAMPYGNADYHGVAGLANRIKEAREAAGKREAPQQEEIGEDLDEGLRWFLGWFKDKPDLETSLSHVLTWRAGGAGTCFLGDADSLILKPDFMAAVLQEVRRHFPSLHRFTVYGRTKTAAKVRTVQELRDFCEAGLDRVHFGLESGSDRVLTFCKKGVTKEEHIEGALKVKEAGLSCSVYVMPGLGGAAWSDEHARETSDVITRISPDYVRLRTLQIFPQTPLHDHMKDGSFEEASEEQVVREIRGMIAGVNTETEILSDSASNLLSINGRLPADRPAMLERMDAYLSLSPREKLVFSLQSRLQSFMGQYGGLSEDISLALSPHITAGGHLNVGGIPDQEMAYVIGLIRSKLMP